MTNRWGYIDPVERVHMQKGLRAMGQPQPFGQPYYQLPRIEGPLANLPQAQNEIIYGNGYNQPRPSHTLEHMAIGAALGYLIGKNWHRGWVRGLVAGLATFIGMMFVLVIGISVADAWIDPNASLGPIFAVSTLISTALAVFLGRVAVRSRNPKTRGSHAR